MTSIIKFTALSGAHDESPPCYLLQVDEFRFLLDCGWDENFSSEVLDNVKRHLHQIDAVLLTYPDVPHLGLLPYLVGKLGLKCPIYATVPIYKMGQMFMYDLYQSRRNSEEFDLFTLDDVDTAFDLVVQVKYSQTVQLKGKGHGLTITPYAAGHMVGGTMWKIVKDGEEDIIYAMDYNHKKERHLDGAVLESLSRPHLLITDAYNALNVQARRKERDQALLTNILSTLRKDGNVLIAVDTAGRVLELSQLLDQMWRNQESGLCAYSIALLNNVSYNVVEFAKSQVEWMSDKIMKMFEDFRTNPFQFRHITLCHTLADLAKVPEPKAVLASVPDLECGFSRDLFVQWASNPRNSIILTMRPSLGCLARQLIENLKLTTLEMEVRRRVCLEGEELEAYRQKEREERMAKQQAEKEAELPEDSDEEMEADSSVPNAPSAPPKTPKHDLMMVEEAKARSSFFKQTKSYPMFPCKEEKVKWDDYGEPIRLEDYVIKEVAMPEGKQEEDPMETAEENEPSAIPTKCILQKQTILVRCSLSFIDFEGRSDGESIKRILSIVKPRQLIIIHGSAEATNNLEEFSRKTLGISKDKIFAPHIGECVDATTESHIYQVKLKDSLMSSVVFSQAKDAELAWVDGQIHFSSATSKGVVGIDGGRENTEDRKTDLVPVLDGLPQNQWASRNRGLCTILSPSDQYRILYGCSGILSPSSKAGKELYWMELKAVAFQSKVKGHRNVFINPPRLSDFKQALTKAGIQAEFSGGVLVCNGVVALRRAGGKICLEGTICEDYYRVRQLLYEQFAII